MTNNSNKKSDSAEMQQPKRRYSCGTGPAERSAALSRPRLSIRRAQMYTSKERLCEENAPQNPPETKIAFMHQNSRGSDHRGSDASLCDAGRAKKVRKPDEGRLAANGKPKRKPRYQTEAAVWKEFIDYILSINSDIVDFKKKRMVSGSRPPSGDYVSTVTQEIAGKEGQVVWAENFRGGDRSGRRTTEGISTKSSLLQRQASKPFNVSLKETREEKKYKDGEAALNTDNNKVPSGTGRAQLKEASVGASGNSEAMSPKSRRQSNDVRSHVGGRKSSSGGGSRNLSERRHTVCGNDIKDILATKSQKGEPSAGAGEASSCGSNTQDKKPSKWTVVRADFEEQHVKKLQSGKLEGWDFLAQTMSAMGNQTSTRQLLYMRYLKRPNDWRHGLSPRAWDQYQYIFSEADLMQRDTSRWKESGGAKPLALQDRLQQKYRPKTTPGGLRGGGSRGESRRRRLVTSQSSIDFYEGGSSEAPVERPVTAM